MTVRKFKRYQNRKLYDLSESKYVTLDKITEFWANGDIIEVQKSERYQQSSDYTVPVKIACIDHLLKTDPNIDNDTIDALFNHIQHLLEEAKKKGNTNPSGGSDS